MPTTININGVTITSEGRSTVILDNGRVLVDGKDVTPEAKQITISIVGNVERIQADVCGEIEVAGDVGEVRTQSGGVTCGPVRGGVKTMSGNVACGEVGGSVSSMSGNVTCTSAAGGASSMSGRVREGGF